MALVPHEDTPGSIVVRYAWQAAGQGDRCTRDEYTHGGAKPKVALEEREASAGSAQDINVPLGWAQDTNQALPKRARAPGSGHKPGSAEKGACAGLRTQIMVGQKGAQRHPL